MNIYRVLALWFNWQSQMPLGALKHTLCTTDSNHVWVSIRNWNKKVICIEFHVMMIQMNEKYVLRRHGESYIRYIYICTVSCCIIYFRVSETFCLLWARVCARSRAMHSTYDGNTYCHIVLLSISRQKQPWRRCGTYDNNVHRIFTLFTNWMTCYGGAYRSSLYSNNKQYNAIWINGRATRAARVCSFLNDMIYIYISIHWWRHSFCCGSYAIWCQKTNTWINSVLFLQIYW